MSASPPLELDVFPPNASYSPSSLTVLDAFKASLFGAGIFFLGLTIALLFLILAKMLDDLLCGNEGYLVRLMGSTEYLNTTEIFPEKSGHQGRKKSAAAPQKKTIQIGAMKF